jgi:RND family efflux transporter MFP subunit
MVAEALLVFPLLRAAPRAGCARHADEARAPRAGGATAVTVARFRPGGATNGTVLPARVKAAEEITILARLSARLSSFAVREGDRVTRGATLATFDASEMQRARAAARAESEAAAIAVRVATRQHQRAESLYASGVIAENDREVAESARRSAEARDESARAALDAIESSAVLRAPFDGVVVRRLVDAGADLAAGTPVLELRSNAGVEIVADVPESDVERIGRADVRAQIGDGPWRAASGPSRARSRAWRSATARSSSRTRAFPPLRSCAAARSRACS